MAVGVGKKTAVKCCLLVVFLVVVVGVNLLGEGINGDDARSSGRGGMRRVLNIAMDSNHLPECIDIDSCADAELNAESEDAACRDDAGIVDYLTLFYCTFEDFHVLCVLIMISFLSPMDCL